MDKQLSPVQLVTNWVEIKEKIPVINNGADKWFEAKISVLLYGFRSLGNLTFEEWSTEFEPTLLKLPNLEEIAVRDQFCEMPILNLLSMIFAMSSSKRDLQNLDLMAKSQESLAIEILHRLIFILARYSSTSILNLVHRPKGSLNSFDAIDEDDQDDRVVLGIFDILQHYPVALSELYNKNYVPISDLVMKTIDLQATFASCAEKSAGSRQNRKAASIRHEPSRQIKAFAQSRYKEKTWKSIRNGAKQILPEVMDHATMIGRPWSCPYQAFDTVYSWLRELPKPT